MTIWDWLVDYCWLLIGLLAGIASDYVTDESAPIAQPVVILISGVWLPWYFLQALGKRLKQAGYRVYFVRKLGFFNSKSVDQSAEIVQSFIKEKQFKQVVIVGHSKGGIIGRQLLVKYNQERIIKKVVAIASPFYGSSLASYSPFRSIREMAPDSQSLAYLQQYNAVNKDIVSIMPRYDNHVRSPKGSRLEGATNIVVDVVGHHRIVYANETTDKVEEILGTLTGNET